MQIQAKAEGSKVQPAVAKRFDLLTNKGVFFNGQKGNQDKNRKWWKMDLDLSFV